MKERVRFDDFMVHFESNAPELSVSFVAYEVADAKYLGGPNEGKEVVCYFIDGEDSVDEDEFDVNVVKGIMEGTIRWRGVWDERLYFNKEEYWGEDLKALSELFCNHIEPWCKAHIKHYHPHAEE